jgi:prolipoprotein diacylglyceryl transferase
MTPLRCYAKVTDWIYELFNHAPSADYRFLPIHSYGFFVALGFFVAASIAAYQMKKREKLGLMNGEDVEYKVGEAPSIAETLFYLFIGFVVGAKLIGIFTSYHMALRTHALSLSDYMLSINHGSLVGGIFLASLFAGSYYYFKNKQKLSVHETVKSKIYPSDNIGDLVVMAALLGVLGANFFNYLENPGDYNEFWSDPIGSLFSGLSIYGGLIFAGTGFGIYAWSKKIHIGHFFDAVAPGFILANGIGRIGCHVSGDGDWGIVNLNPKPDWIPQWLWTYTYPHHIVSDPHDVLIPGCVEEHCYQLAQAVYPTPLYEFMMCAAICIFLLWFTRYVLHKPGMVFSVFLILIGIQRYTIEIIRDIGERNTGTILGMNLRQSQFISIVMILVGIIGTLYLWNYYKKYSLTKKS